MHIYICVSVCLSVGPLEIETIQKRVATQSQHEWIGEKRSLYLLGIKQWNVEL